MGLPTGVVSQDFFIDVSAAADRDGVLGWDSKADATRSSFRHLILLVI